MEKQDLIEKIVIDFKGLSRPEKIEVLDILMQHAINEAKLDNSTK
jgi:DNA-binding protein YbaB|tara:strand:+ start:696 stop:830 length:135 start_codon:yes stop_codon:yes gene_type:complete